jgi:hypothetical protein
VLHSSLDARENKREVTVRAMDEGESSPSSVFNGLSLDRWLVPTAGTGYFFNSAVQFVTNTNGVGLFSG